LRIGRSFYGKASSWMAGTALVGTALVGIASPATALPRECRVIRGEYHVASDLSAYWHQEYLNDYAREGLTDQTIADYHTYEDYEDSRVELAQELMANDC
jgi:hypothetical protein